MAWNEGDDAYPHAALINAERTVESLADLVREMYLIIDGDMDFVDWAAQVEETFVEWELEL